VKNYSINRHLSKLSSDARIKPRQIFTSQYLRCSSNVRKPTSDLAVMPWSSCKQNSNYTCEKSLKNHIAFTTQSLLATELNRVHDYLTLSEHGILGKTLKRAYIN